MRFVALEKSSYKTVVTPLITSSLYLLIFGVSLGKNIQLSNGLTYLAFIIPGLVMMGVLSNSYQNSSSSVVSGRFSGDLQDLKVAPLSDSQIIWGITLGGVIRGLIVGVITFLVGQFFYYFSYDSWMSFANPLVLLFFVTVGGVAFGLLGLSVAIWSKSFDQLSAVSSFVLMPLIYLGGVFFSLENLHPVWQIVSKFNPLLYLINGVRFGILGVSDVNLGLSAVLSLMTVGALYLLAKRNIQDSSFLRW